MNPWGSDFVKEAEEDAALRPAMTPQQNRREWIAFVIIAAVWLAIAYVLIM